MNLSNILEPKKSIYVYTREIGNLGYAVLDANIGYIIFVANQDQEKIEQEDFKGWYREKADAIEACVKLVMEAQK